MVGFGFMDNSIMIYAGDWIDCNIGVRAVSRSSNCFHLPDLFEFRLTYEHLGNPNVLPYVRQRPVGCIEADFPLR